MIVKPGGRVVLTLARDRFLKRYHFHTYYWDGRTRDGGIAPPGRYKLRVKLLGAGPRRWCRRGRSSCTSADSPANPATAARRRPAGAAGRP